MIRKLKSLFGSQPSKEVLVGTEAKQVATAALLVEAAMSDEDYSQSEQDTLKSLLKRHFSLSDTDADEVIKEAEDAHSKADHLLTFTRTIKEEIPLDERISIIEMLWEIAYADGALSDYEANLIRRICGLIYVDDMDSGNARKRVLQKLGLPN